MLKRWQRVVVVASAMTVGQAGTARLKDVSILTDRAMWNGYQWVWQPGYWRC